MKKPPSIEMLQAILGKIMTPGCEEAYLGLIRENLSDEQMKEKTEEFRRAFAAIYHGLIVLANEVGNERSDFLTEKLAKENRSTFKVVKTSK